MRKYAVLLFLLLIPSTVFAQSDRGRDDDWRRRRAAPRRDTFELAPFVGYRWGGTIFADQTSIFGGNDVQVENSPSLGATLGIPIGGSGMKLELMANRQSSELVSDAGLFEPEDEITDIDVTYLHAGLQIPFGRGRNATPYFVVSAGVANLDPQLRGVSAENRFSASAGLGVKAPFSDSLAFKFEGRGYYTALEEEDECSICDYLYNEDFYQGEVSFALVFSF